ncbi:MAG: hypothetical protein V4478_01765 [Patescibacteria group bacterium]
MIVENTPTDSLETAKSVLAFIIEIITQVIAEAHASGVYPKDFTCEIKTNTSSCYEIYINGTKTKGSDYMLTGWKEVPMIKAEILRESIPDGGESFVSLEALGFPRLTDSKGVMARWKESGQLKSEIGMSVKNAIETFTDQN